MNTKDVIEIIYWSITLLILSVTVYWIATSPIKAVEIGRKLDNEQNKYNAKLDLFLTLFSLRGNPSHYDFVNNLNKIDVVYEDSPKVLFSWAKLYESLHHPNQNNAVQSWELLRTDLLSEMALTLGYNALKQTTIQKSYVPKIHSDIELSNQDYHSVSKAFFESGCQLNHLLIDFYSNQHKENENKLSDKS